MTQQEVIIELKYNQNQDTTTYQASTSSGGKTVNITVKRSNEPQGSNFYRYTHTLQNGGGQFILKEVKDDKNQEISVITTGNNVSSVSAYYWANEQANGSPPTKVLIIGVTTQGNATPTYYGNINHNGSNEWTILNNHSKPPLIGGDIERTLDDLVCSNYGGVTIDLSKSTSMSGRASNGEPYCCRCHGKGDNGIDQRKITVELKKASCRHKNANYYKHTVNSGPRVARIRYYIGDTNANDPNNRRRIKLTGYGFPLPNVQAVYALYCGGNPVLIYVEGGNTQINKWFKRPTSTITISNDNTDENWIEFLGLSNIKPVDLNNTMDCEKYNQLIKALREFPKCSSLGKCPTSTKPLTLRGPGAPGTTPPGPAGPAGAGGIGGVGIGGPKPDANASTEADERGSEDTTSGVGDRPDSVDDTNHTESGGGQGPSGGTNSLSSGTSAKPPESPKVEPTPAPGGKHEKFFAETTIGIAGYFFAGTAGSGLTGFLGYKGYKLYQNFKGDPWVRQI